MSIAYSPSSLEETKGFFKKDLKGKRSSPEMDEFLERHYNIKGDQGFDALEKIMRVIHKESGTINRLPWARYLFVRVMFFHLDILLLIKSYFRKTFYREFQYNYCSFWNKPSSFMKRAASKFNSSLNLN